MCPQIEEEEEEEEQEQEEEGVENARQAILHEWNHQ